MHDAVRAYVELEDHAGQGSIGPDKRRIYMTANISDAISAVLSNIGYAPRFGRNAGNIFASPRYSGGQRRLC